MNQLGRIKLMSRKLVSKECYELHKYFYEEAQQRSKKEKVESIVNLGVGGRVVYSTSNTQYDVTGKVGTILKIRKNKNGVIVFEIKFDSPVWTRINKLVTKEFYEWWHKKAEIPTEKKRIIMEGKHSMSGIQKVYEKETGLKSKYEQVQQGNILINITANNLLPATEEYIKNSQLTREMIPLTNALNKTLRQMLRKSDKVINNE